MKESFKYFLVGLLLLGVNELAYSDDKASHTVTVTVSAINQLSIAGGDVNLTINTATAGSDPDAATDNTTSDLNWVTNEASKKITVATNLAAPNFTLSIDAQNVTGGTPSGIVTLSTTATDFVTGINKVIGVCDLSYTAIATASNTSGSDTHAITFTITDE